MISEVEFCNLVGVSRDRAMRPLRKQHLVEGEDWCLVSGQVMFTAAGMKRAKDLLGMGEELHGDGREEPVAESIAEPECESDALEDARQLADQVVEDTPGPSSSSISGGAVMVRIARVWPERPKQLLGLVDGKKVRVMAKHAPTFQVGMLVPCHERKGIYYYRGVEITRWNRKKFYKKG